MKESQEFNELLHDVLKQLSDAHASEVQALQGEIELLKDAVDNMHQLPCNNEIPFKGPPQSGAELPFAEAENEENVFMLKRAWVAELPPAGAWEIAFRKEEVSVQVKKFVDRKSLLTAKSHLSADDEVHAWWLLIPTNHFRLSWDFAGVIFIVYDMVTIPLFLAFEPDENLFMTVAGWIILSFWTCDMLMSLFTCYYDEGHLVSDQHQIVIHYLKGWFWIDTAVVAPDWIFKVFGSTTNVAGIGRVLRVARIMRTLRTVRLLKLKKLMNFVYDEIDSEYSFIILNLAQLLWLVIGLSHWVACCWYFIGRATKDSGEINWLEDRGLTPVWGTSLAWKYLTSLHWSITQFTPASMDISATNIPERLFSVVILFWSLVMLSSIIGSVTAGMTALRSMSSDETKRMWMLRRYLKQQRASRALTHRIVNHLEYLSSVQHHRLVASKVTLLTHLSEQLKLELSMQIYSPLMCHHPLLAHMANKNPPMVARICEYTLESLQCAVDDVVFQPGDRASAMYFVRQGEFRYTLADGQVIDHPLGTKAYVCEAVLWTEWRHRGSLTSQEHAEVVLVSPEKFAEQVRMHPRSFHLACKYATLFLEYMNSVSSSALTDVIFDHARWASVVGSCDSRDYQIASESYSNGGENHASASSGDWEVCSDLGPSPDEKLMISESFVVPI